MPINIPENKINKADLPIFSDLNSQPKDNDNSYIKLNHRSSVDNLPIFFIFTILILSLVSRIYWILPNHDVTWIFLASQRLFAGGRYYYDIHDLTPPLIEIIKFPGIIIGKAFGFAPWTGFIIWIHLLILLSLALVVPYLRWVSDHTAMSDLVLFVYFLTLTLVPSYSFGQREHLTTILSFPALVLFSAEEAGFQRNISPRTITIWAIGALGFLIKPFFLIVPAALILLRAVRRRNWRFLFCMEAYTLFLVTIIYWSLVIILYREWFSLAKIALDVYFGYSSSFLSAFNSLNAIFKLLIFTGVLLVFFPRSQSKVFFSNLALSASLFFIIAVLQKKGWMYHCLPANELLYFIICGLLIQLLAHHLQGDRRNRLVYALTAAILIFQIYVVQRKYPLVLNMSFRSDFLKREFPDTLIQLNKNKSWLALSTNMYPISPAGLLVDGVKGFKSNIQWMIPGIVKLSHGDIHDQHLANEYHKLITRFLVDDIEHDQPKLIAVSQGPHLNIEGPLDLVEFFSRDEKFRRKWAEYELCKSISGWKFYKHKDSIH